MSTQPGGYMYNTVHAPKAQWTWWKRRKEDCKSQKDDQRFCCEFMYPRNSGETTSMIVVCLTVCLSIFYLNNDNTNRYVIMEGLFHGPPSLDRELQPIMECWECMMKTSTEIIPFISYLILSGLPWNHMHISISQ